MSNPTVDDENLTSYKYILGEMGIQILIAISRGADTKNTIRLLSGVPFECVHGRIPVLTSLELIYQIQEKYYITKRGNLFLGVIEHDN